MAYGDMAHIERILQFAMAALTNHTNTSTHRENPEKRGSKIVCKKKHPGSFPDHAPWAESCAIEGHGPNRTIRGVPDIIHDTCATY